MLKVIVFFSAAEGMGLEPTSCLALEDSLNGVLSAKSARMRVIAIPEQYKNHALGFHIADSILASLKEVEDTWKSQFTPK